MQRKHQFILFALLLLAAPVSVGSNLSSQEKIPRSELRHLPGENPVNALIMSSDTAIAGQLKKIDVLMENESDISAFQFDLLLPENLSVKADLCSLTERSDGHSLSIRYISDNVVRFVSYSGSLKTYHGNSGSLLQIALQTAPEISPAVYDLQIENVVLSDVTGKNAVTGVHSGQFKVLPNTVCDTAYISICEGETYVFGNDTLTHEGEYTHTFTSAAGGDSVVILHLRVLHEYHSYTKVSICEGESYPFGDQDLMLPGTYTEVFQSANGCDSIVEVALYFLSYFIHTYSLAICEGESFKFGSQMLSESGEYTMSYPNLNYCGDSVVNLYLEIIPVITQTVDAAICNGESYSFGGQTMTAAGEYTEVFQSASGCDSVVTLQLTVNPVYSYNTTATICEGESYEFGSQLLKEPGDYTELFQSATGCDSLVNLHLTNNPSVNNKIEAVICEGESWFFNEQHLTQAGEYVEMLTTISGCDSVSSLSLKVIPDYETFVTDTLFNGDSIMFGDQVLTEAGEYSYNFPSISGCDSVVHLTLAKSTTTSAVLPAGTFFFMGQNYPNPFTCKTTIPFILDRNIEEVIISIHDITGREVKKCQIKKPVSGQHNVEWQSEGKQGMFFYNMHVKWDGIYHHTPLKRMVVQ